MLALASLVPAAPARAAATPALYGFGSNYSGEFGNGTTTDSLVPTPASAVPGTVTEVATGLESSAAVLADGSVWAMGSNFRGQLGNCSPDIPTPWRITQLSGVTHVALGIEGSGFAIEANGTLWAWGDNTFGELGDGTTTTFCTPPEQVPSLSAIIQVVAGDGYTLALRTDGTVWGWGANGFGQLGDGTTTSRLLPELIMSGVVRIAAAGGESFAVRSDGTLLAWGSNGFGGLGNGLTSGFTDVPAQVPGLGGVTQVATNGNSTLAVAGAARTVWAWGFNECGELGDGTTTNKLAPEPIGLSGVTQVTLGTHFLFTGYSAAVRSDGTLWTWGCNDFGQLGYGAVTAFHPAPTQVTTIVGVSQFAFGDATTNVLTNHGAYGLAIGLLPATVPNLSGDKLATARTVLQGAGLVLGTVTDVVDPTCNHLGAVLSQSPAAGTRVSFGTAVTVKVGISPSPPHACQ